MLLDFREGKGGKERERERNRNYLPLVCVLTRDQICNLGTCPDGDQTGDLLVYSH